MSCVGYQSRLFPVCVNRLPHRLCLGYTSPWGVAFKTAGHWWEIVHVFLWASYQPTVCTGHRVVLQYNLIMSALLYPVLTPYTHIDQLAEDSLVRKSESGFVYGSCHWNWFQSVIWPQQRNKGAGNMTGHTPKLSIHSCASLPPHTGLLGHMLYYCCCSSNLLGLAVLCECLLWQGC